MWYIYINVGHVDDNVAGVLPSQWANQAGEVVPCVAAPCMYSIVTEIHSGLFCAGFITRTYVLIYLCFTISYKGGNHRPPPR